MQIPIKLSAEEDGDLNEWVLLELQGDLESRTQEDMKNKFIGDLHFTKQGGIPVLIIGHHILYGKVQDLEKPFIYLRKISGAPQENCMDASIPVSSTEYSVEAVIQKKVLFKTRPKPIIASMKNYSP
ncbi:chromosome transmission fidelity protein 8 homolog [Macrobrachium rosenbergii]|uniref:chromosome transmission fidelity protein 8 homolog n=1 Tax=Macrobrachium rosenbergii TaxID=79674 RepID=UPI0034D4E497